MSDILSQDEIDRLLHATGDETPSGGLDDLTPEQVEAVEKVARVFFASANSAFAALLAKPSSVSEGVGQVVDLAELAGDRLFLIRFPFRSGLEGEIAFALKQPEASQLADLILGGEGEAKETLDESDLDALKEALTQVAGSGAPALSTTLDREVGFGAPTAVEVEAGKLSEALPWGHAFLGVGSAKVEGVLDTPLRMLLTIDLARELSGLLATPEETEVSADFPSVVTTSSSSNPSIAAPARPGATVSGADIRNIDLILDIEVEAMVRLGEAEMPLRDIQRLRPGSIIDLDKDTEAPVELVVNNRVLAKGELVVVGSDHFALRITEIEAPSERIRTLGPI